MKNMNVIIKTLFNIDTCKKYNLYNSIDNISFAATVGFVSGAIYGVEYYFGSLVTGLIGLCVGGVAGFTCDRVLPLK